MGALATLLAVAALPCSKCPGGIIGIDGAIRTFEKYLEQKKGRV